MIKHIEARNFRMLASNRLDLKPFHTLVGPNGSGKTTFLDALQFISDILSLGVNAAVKRRATNFFELCFKKDLPISFAVEVEIPNSVQPKSSDNRAMRYELELSVDKKAGVKISKENLFVIPSKDDEVQQSLFGWKWNDVIVHPNAPAKWRKVVSKTGEGKDYFRDEKTQWNNMFKFGVDKAALGSLPEDPERFSLSIFTRNLLKDGIRTLALDARKMREPSSPGTSNILALDGSNLPHVVMDLKEKDSVLFEQWVKHLSTSIYGLSKVNIRERPEDKFLILEAEFKGSLNVAVPSWLLSDGTLRLMALTLLSYASDPNDTDLYLIEEPENGLHPLAIESAYKALVSPPGDMQIFCATHSPIFLSNVKLDEVLVFKRAKEGYSIVRHGDEVPELKDWTTTHNLGDLLVTGVLS